MSQHVRILIVEVSMTNETRRARRQLDVEQNSRCATVSASLMPHARVRASLLIVQHSTNRLSTAALAFINPFTIVAACTTLAVSDFGAAGRLHMSRPCLRLALSTAPGNQ